MESQTKFTFREAAAQLGIGYSTLRQYVAQRKIGVYRAGRNTNWIFKSELDAFVKRNSTKVVYPI
jgi:excisionase family DNA binding protein